MSELPRAKGPRPVFLGSAVADDLVAMVMALTQELAVLRERCDTTERLLVRHDILSPDEIETFAPDEAADQERELWRQDYLDRILFVVNSRSTERMSGDSLASYQAAISDIAETEDGVIYSADPVEAR